MSSLGGAEPQKDAFRAPDGTQGPERRETHYQTSSEVPGVPWVGQGKPNPEGSLAEWLPRQGWSLLKEAQPLTLRHTFQQSIPPFSTLGPVFTSVLQELPLGSGPTVQRAPCQMEMTVGL